MHQNVQNDSRWSWAASPQPIIEDFTFYYFLINFTFSIPRKLKKPPHFFSFLQLKDSVRITKFKGQSR